MRIITARNKEIASWRRHAMKFYSVFNFALFLIIRFFFYFLTFSMKKQHQQKIQ